MSRTYDAVLTGTNLEWKGSPPSTEKPTDVQVVVPDEADACTSAERRRRAAAALEELAATGGIDYTAWRASRADRPLPGREE